MKKTMRIAAMLASAGMMSAVMPVQPASAQIWTLVGSETETAFQDMIQLDDKGMLNFSGSDKSYQVYMQYCTDYHDTEVTDPETGETRIERVYYDSCHVYTVTPIMDTLWFVLREDQPDAEEKMLAIMEQYYPEISKTFAQREPNEYASLTPHFYNLNDGSSTGLHKYELRDLTESAGSPERADSIMHDLAEDGLISEFYTWGQIAYCQQIFGWLGYGENSFDKEKVEEWLASHSPESNVIENVRKIGDIEVRDYQLVPAEDLSFAEQFSISADIYEATGIRPAIGKSDTIQQVSGQNALAVTGDINIDCSIDVADAVLLARVCAEDAAANITQTGIGNADLDDNGILTVLDVTAILRMIA